MKYYIATGYNNKDLYHRWDKILKDTFSDQNPELTYDWTKNTERESLTLEEYQTIGKLELEGIEHADFVLAILPGGKGTHIEIGYALGWGIPVIILTDKIERQQVHSESSPFYHQDEVVLISMGLPTEKSLKQLRAI